MQLATLKTLGDTPAANEHHRRPVCKRGAFRAPNNVPPGQGRGGTHSEKEEGGRGSSNLAWAGRNRTHMTQLTKEVLTNGKSSHPCFSGRMATARWRRSTTFFPRE